jgi:hypothetical protein
VFAAGSTRCQVSARIASKERETFLPLFQAFARSFKLKLPPKKM